MTPIKIPQTQVAAVPKPEIRKDVPVKQPSQLAPGECLIKIICTGVCHSDLHTSRGDWPVTAVTPLIGGHEGVGTIVAIGAHTENSPVQVGQRVGIKWLAYSCLNCEQCRTGLEQCCPQARNSGLNVDGTFAQYVVSWVQHVTPIPESLDSQAAASVLCAGLTVYRALKYSGARIGNWVVLPGAAVQYAVAMGMRVVAIDTGADKRDLCLELGAEKWIDFKETQDIVSAIKEACDGQGAHCAVVTTATSAGYAQAIDYLRPGGSLMVVGLPGSAKLESSIFWTVLKSISILGSYVGNRQDTVEALEIRCSRLKSLSQLQEVYDGLAEGKIAGRIVLDVSQ
ncbi:chaperonin 10-like protein [Pisolithus microcarpus]|nr:chaperonin 10-like protein [Pisolithus microcarpus]